MGPGVDRTEDQVSSLWINGEDQMHNVEVLSSH